MLYADRTQETSTTTGTGTVTLAGAVTGFQSFTSAFQDQDRVAYRIDDGTNWETGIGVFTASGTTLTREYVLESSNAGALVNFPAGTKLVASDMPAKSVVDKGLAYAFVNRMVRR